MYFGGCGCNLTIGTDVSKKSEEIEQMTHLHAAWAWGTRIAQPCITASLSQSAVCDVLFAAFMLSCYWLSAERIVKTRLSISSCLSAHINAAMLDNLALRLEVDLVNTVITRKERTFVFLYMIALCFSNFLVEHIQNIEMKLPRHSCTPVPKLMVAFPPLLYHAK